MMCSDLELQDLLRQRRKELNALEEVLTKRAKVLWDRVSALGRRVRLTQEMQNDLIAEKGHHEKLLKEQSLAIGVLAKAILLALEPIEPLNKAKFHERLVVASEVKKIFNYYDGREI